MHLSLLAVQLFFASFSPVGKIALRALPALALATVRVTLAAAVLALIWAAWRQLVPAARAERVAAGDALRLGLYSLFGVTANQLLFLAGLARTTATSALVLGTSIPVFTAVGALLLGRERATRLKLAGLAVALGGALALTSASHAGEGSGALVGNLLILVNSLSYAIYLVISREVLQRMSPLTAMTIVFGCGALFVDLVVGAAGALGLVPFHLRDLPAMVGGLGSEPRAALIYIVAVPTVAAYLLNAVALRAVPASLVAIYIYVQPVIGAALAALLLGERPTMATLLAAGAIFAGIALVNLDAQRRARVATSAARRPPRR